MFFKRVIAFFWIDTPILGLIASFFSLIITKGQMELIYTYMPILMIFQSYIWNPVTILLFTLLYFHSFAQFALLQWAKSKMTEQIYPIQ